MMAVERGDHNRAPASHQGRAGTGKDAARDGGRESAGRPLFEWNIKSTMNAQHGLYEYDAVSRLRDSQLGRRARARDQHYICAG